MGSSRWMWPWPLVAGAPQILEATVAQRRPSLLHLEVGLSPGPGAMRVESDEQGHCLKTGARCSAVPQGLRRGDRDIWGGTDLICTDANKLFYNEAAVLSICQSMPSQGAPRPILGMPLAFLTPLVLRSMAGTSAAVPLSSS